MRGLEFRMPSILVAKVHNSLSVNGWLPKDLYNRVFTDFTPASQRPPKFGARGGMKDRSIPRGVQCFMMASQELESSNQVLTSAKYLAAPTKFVPLSEKMRAGAPRLAMNRSKASRKPSVDKLGTTSR